MIGIGSSGARRGLCTVFLLGGLALASAGQAAPGRRAVAPGRVVFPVNGGIPTVKAGNNVTFNNEDASADIYHSITACQNPCNGATGIAYPLSNAAISGVPLNSDSTTLGYGPPGLGAPSNTYSYLLKTQGIPADTTLTYFCRIHPFMRGELQVVP